LKTIWKIYKLDDTYIARFKDTFIDACTFKHVIELAYNRFEADNLPWKYLWEYENQIQNSKPIYEYNPRKLVSTVMKERPDLFI